MNAKLRQLLACPLAELRAKPLASLMQTLGPLAAWWLDPEVYRRAVAQQPGHKYEPRLPSTPGGCWIVLVRRQEQSLLRPAFLLPLQWRVGMPHSPRLPEGLRRLAERVCEQAALSNSWGLQLAPGLEGLDLAALVGEEFSWESGWASLFAGLILGTDDLGSNPTVWASAAWDEHFGIGAIDGLAAKLELARQWGVDSFFLPAENQREALHWRLNHGGSIDLDVLTPVAEDPKPRKLLSAYLAACGAQPAPSDPWPRRVAYYKRLPRGRAERFFFSHLLEDVVGRCRESFQKEFPTCAITHLATVIGHSPAVVAQAPLLLRANRALLFYDAGHVSREPNGSIAQSRDQVRALLEKHGIACQLAPIAMGDLPTELAAMRHHILRFRDIFPPEGLGIDLTPGHKPLSIALAEAAPPGSWLLYSRHQQAGPDHGVDPASVRYECWRKPHSDR